MTRQLLRKQQSMKGRVCRKTKRHSAYQPSPPLRAQLPRSCKCKHGVSFSYSEIFYFLSQCWSIYAGTRSSSLAFVQVHVWSGVLACYQIEADNGLLITASFTERRHVRYNWQKRIFIERNKDRNLFVNVLECVNPPLPNLLIRRRIEGLYGGLYSEMIS